MCDKESTFNCANAWFGRQSKKDKNPIKRIFCIAEKKKVDDFIRLKYKNGGKKYDHYDD